MAERAVADLAKAVLMIWISEGGWIYGVCEGSEFAEMDRRGGV